MWHRDWRDARVLLKPVRHVQQLIMFFWTTCTITFTVIKKQNYNTKGGCAPWWQKISFNFSKIYHRSNVRHVVRKSKRCMSVIRINVQHVTTDNIHTPFCKNKHETTLVNSIWQGAEEMGILRAQHNWNVLHRNGMNEMIGESFRSVTQTKGDLKAIFAGERRWLFCVIS